MSANQLLSVSRNEDTTEDDTSSYLDEADSLSSNSELFQLYCPTCFLSYSDEESYKLHYKSDLHLYNIKRKLVGLKPEDMDSFNSKISFSKRAENVNKPVRCEVCNKDYKNKATFKHHARSKKHKKNKQRKDKAKEEEELLKYVTQIGGETTFKKKKVTKSPLDGNNICLFSNEEYESFEQNLEEMEANFGFFYLESHCLVNPKGLFHHIANLIVEENKCVYCNSHYKSYIGVQQHMIDKGHCMMNSDFFGQYDKFYDFKQFNQEKALRLKERYGEGAQMKTVTLEDGQEIQLPVFEKLGSGQLKLPDGRVLGNKEFMKYYKQNLKSKKIDDPLSQVLIERAAKRKIIEMQAKMIGSSQLANLTDENGVIIAQNLANQVKKCQKQIYKQSMKAVDRKNKIDMRIGFQMNKLNKGAQTAKFQFN